MQFLSIYKPAKPSTAPPDPKHMAEMQKFVEDAMKAGTLLTTGSVGSAANGARVRLAQGKFTVTEGAGPAGQAMAGFAILKTKTKAECIELAQRFLKLAGDGESELHQLMEY